MQIHTFYFFQKYKKMDASHAMKIVFLFAVVSKPLLCLAQECPGVDQFKNALDMCVTCADLDCVRIDIEECQDHGCPGKTLHPLISFLFNYLFFATTLNNYSGNSIQRDLI